MRDDYLQDGRPSPWETVKFNDPIYFVEEIPVRNEYGSYLGSIVVRQLRPEVPTPVSRRHFVASLTDVDVRGRI